MTQAKHPCRIVRSATIPGSLNTFCRGQLAELSAMGYDVVAVSSPDPQLRELADREGVNVCAVPFERHISIAADLRSLWLMWRALRRIKPRMVHSMTPKAGLISMMAARLAGVPVRVHTFTGLIWPTATGMKRRILMLTDRILCACATHIVPEGQGARHDLLSAGITRKDLRVLANGNVRGIDPDHYCRSEQVMAQADKIRVPGVFTFVFVGRLVADKGIRELVYAFSRLHAEHPDTRLILVGRQEPQLDPLPAETLRLIESSDAIQAVGNQDDVRPWMAASDALAFPSYREGFPNVVIEAGAMGLPSIVTDINGSREIVVDGLNGLIIPIHSADALHDAMLRLYSARALCQRLAEAARPRAVTNWSQSVVRKALYDFYDSILAD